MSTTISGDTGVDKFEGTTIAGHVIQVANYTTGAYSTATATFPFDNTIPQIIEGFEVMSLAFTPKKATSKLKITVVTNVNHDSASTGALTALFRDSGGDSIGVCQTATPTAGYYMSSSFVVYVNATNTNLTTFRVRVGASAGVVRFNGNPSGQLFGGSLASSITIEEIAQ